MVVASLSAVRAAHIVLASASPRRSAILNEQLGLNARVVPSGFAEDLDKAAYTPVEYVKETARLKALDVYQRSEVPFMAKHSRPPSLVIGADTIVCVNNKILEKPSSVGEARSMLQELSAAGTHTVCTGVAMVYGGSSLGAPENRYVHTFAETTTVRFKELTNEEIEAYVATGEPMDKAGAYGIQGLGGAFVEGVVGDYSNVVGFPVARFCKEIDPSRLRDWIDAAPLEEPPPPTDVASPQGEYIFSTECVDEDECGLPSD